MEIIQTTGSGQKYQIFSKHVSHNYGSPSVAGAQIGSEGVLTAKARPTLEKSIPC